ncbi:hypothetical protein [Aestuariivirga sp.]|jgi:hypothetical protein|nr:hypothetical protein [Aestuariivirga sp.]
MTDGKHSIRIKAKGFEATAQGWGGLLTLVLLAALVASGRALGWW